MPAKTSLWLLATATILSGAAVLGRSPITDCLDTSKVPQALPGTSDFSRYSTAWNLRLNYTPAAIALPSVPAHVQDAVRCAASNKHIVSALSGGHSYAAFGLGGEDGHLVIDMKNFNTITVNNATNVATIGSGARLGNVAIALYEQGGRALSHGTCPGVGFGGLVLGGGYGYSSRREGLTLDSLREVEVILADGSLVTASQSQYPDLFWAMRGAGSSFGIATTFKLDTFQAPKETVVFDYEPSINTTAKAITLLTALQEFANTTQPRELQTRLQTSKDGTHLRGTYTGSLSSFNTAIQPLLARLGNPQGTVKSLGWLDSLTNYAGGPLAQPLDNYTNHDKKFAKSLMTPPLSAASIAALADYLVTVAPKNSRNWWLELDMYGGPSSAVTQVPVGDTAYPHRAGTLLKMQFSDGVMLYAPWPQGMEGFNFLNEWVSSIEGGVPEGSPELGMYANYPDTSLSPEEAQHRYYGVNLERLRALKGKWDPAGRFGNPQSVMAW